MQGLIITVLTLAYILCAFIGPVVALGLSGYWAYSAYQADPSVGGAILTFVISLFVMLLVLGVLVRVLKWVMNMVDLDEETEADAPK